MTWFWEVVHGFSEEQKKRLLFFVTGSDRVPIKGLASLQPPFVISRNGPSSNRLPTAHTCFNHLLLPAYNVRRTGMLNTVDGCLSALAVGFLMKHLQKVRACRVIQKRACVSLGKERAAWLGGVYQALF